MNKYLSILFGSLLLLNLGCSEGDPKAKGFDLYDSRNFDNALPLLEKAWTASQDDPELGVRLAYCLAEVRNDPEAALKILHASTLKFPDYARTYYQLGFIAFRHGNTKDKENLHQALGFTRKAAQLDESNFKIVDNVGMYHSMLGNLDSALYWLERAILIDPHQPQLKARIEGTRKQIIEKAKRDSVLVADTLRLGS